MGGPRPRWRGSLPVSLSCRGSRGNTGGTGREIGRRVAIADYFSAREEGKGIPIIKGGRAGGR